MNVSSREFLGGFGNVKLQLDGQLRLKIAMWQRFFSPLLAEALMRSLQDCAFHKCDWLRSICIPSSVESVGSLGFAGALHSRQLHSKPGLGSRGSDWIHCPMPGSLANLHSGIRSNAW
jgi:hypothetical protein